MNTTEVLKCGCVMEHISIDGVMKCFLVEECDEHFDDDQLDFEPTPLFKKFRKGVLDYA